MGCVNPRPLPEAREVRYRVVRVDEKGETMVWPGVDRQGCPDYGKAKSQFGRYCYGKGDVTDKYALVRFDWSVRAGQRTLLSHETIMEG